MEKRNSEERENVSMAGDDIKAECEIPRDEDVFLGEVQYRTQLWGNNQHDIIELRKFLSWNAFIH